MRSIENDFACIELRLLASLSDSRVMTTDQYVAYDTALQAMQQFRASRAHTAAQQHSSTAAQQRSSAAAQQRTHSSAHAQQRSSTHAQQRSSTQKACFRRRVTYYPENLV